MKTWCGKYFLSGYVLVFCSLLAGISDLTAEEYSDTLGLQIEAPSYFSLTVETYMLPIPGMSDFELWKPSKNSIQSMRSLNGEIDFGYLIARKDKNSILPLISEYKVRLLAKCQTNRGKPYKLYQSLVSPITGETTGAVFPEESFVCQTSWPEGDVDKKGQMLVVSPRSVIPGDNLELYQSAYGDNQLSQNVVVDYWVTDSQSQVVNINQQADQYRSTLVITLTELG